MTRADAPPDERAQAEPDGDRARTRPTTRRRRPPRSRRRRRRRRAAAARSPSWRTAGGGRWPTWTTCASGTPGSWPRERAAERARVAAALLPVLDNLELALRARRRPTRPRSSRASGRSGTRPWPCWRGSAIPRYEDESACRSTRPGTRSVARGPDEPDAAPGTVVQVLRPGYGDAERQLRPAAVVVGRPAGSEPMARDYYEVLGVPATPTPRRSSGPTGKLARHTTRTSTRTPAAEDRFKEINEAYHVLSDPETAAPLRPVRRGLPAGPGGLRRPRAAAARAAAAAGGARAAGPDARTPVRRLPGRRLRRRGARRRPRGPVRRALRRARRRGPVGRRRPGGRARR